MTDKQSKYLVIYFNISPPPRNGEPHYCEETGFGPNYREFYSKLQALAFAETAWKVEAILSYKVGDGLDLLKHENDR